MLAQKVAAYFEAQTGYKSVSWQEANADLRHPLPCAISDRAHRDGRDVADVLFRHQHHLDDHDEKRQDIAIMKSLGMREYAVRIVEAAMIGVVGILFGGLSVTVHGWSKITIFNPRPAPPFRWEIITR